mgnify:CR=1 FL=1
MRLARGVAVAGPDGRVRTRLVETIVRFKRLEAAEIDAYLASGEWRGKAGGYAIQGRAGAFMPWISGSFTGLVGLPLAETAALLAAAETHARQSGASGIEAYPVDPDSPSYRFSGFVPAFEKAGFVAVARAGTRRHVLRKMF